MNPPKIVKLCLECIFIILDSKKLTWDEIVSELKTGKFLQKVLNTNYSLIPEEVFNRIKKEY